MISRKLAKFFSDDSGVSLVEYSLIAALVAVVAIAALTQIGTSLENTLNTISGELGAG